jgi:sugar/nucleoside kinase (ribokinase family)
VPLPSRLELIELGYRNHAYVLASFVSEEIETVLKLRALEKINLISVNLEEAAALANVSLNASVKEIVERCIQVASQFNPDIRICITCGSQGIYGYEKGKTEFIPIIEVPVRNTAGAGDAVLAGIMIGLVLGFPFIGNRIRSCLRMGRLIGAMSVTSDDTINFDINLERLKQFQKIYGEEIV